MARTLSTQNSSEVTKPLTRPLYLVEILFTTPLRLSSRETLTYDSDTYTAAKLEVSLQPPNASLSLYNDGLAYGSQFISAGPGAEITIYEIYGEAPFSPGDADIFYHGETSSTEIGEFIEIQLRPTRPQFTPRYIASDEIFSHLPPDGTRLETPNGVFVLKRDN